MITYFKNIFTRLLSHLKNSYKSHPKTVLLIGLLNISSLTLVAFYGLSFSSEIIPAIFQHPVFSAQHGGQLEIYGYMMIMLSIYYLFKIAIITRLKYIGIFFAIFTLVLIDDSLELHEKISFFYRENYGISIDYDDLFGFLTIGIPIIIMWLISCLLVPRIKQHIADHGILTSIFGGLIFFGVFIDTALTYLIKNYSFPETIQILIEDGSEMLLMSLLAVTTLSMYQKSIPK
jgi:hypothetical protein